MEQATGRLGRSPGTAALRLDRYQPKGIDSAAWSQVQPFVSACATRLSLGHTASGLRTARVLARLAAWCVAEGIALDPELVLDPETVERFVCQGVADTPSRATYRSVLRRIGPALTATAPWEARPTVLARRHVALPYSEAELSGLRAAATRQATPGRIRAARALLALGAGAGLDGRWVARVSAVDVVVRSGSVQIWVGEPSPRLVPVLVEWEREVLDLATSAGGCFLVGGRSTAKNRAGSLAASLEVGHGSPKFSASRLRSTWLVQHLRLGTRLPELTRAAGLAGITVVSDLLEHVIPVGEAEAAEMMRGPR